MSDFPESPVPFNLGFLRKDAKRLTRACRAGDDDALGRLRRLLPHMVALDKGTIASTITLADAQQAIAREQGCANWAAVKRAGEPLDQLLVAVRGGDLAAITSSLDTGRALTRDSAHAACALSDAEALRHHLEQDPTLASMLHRGWPPLAYACASPVHRLSGRHSAGLLECATMLIDRGADVNTRTPADHGVDLPVPVVVRALRSSNHAVMMLLQRRGADDGLARPHVRRLAQTPQPFGTAVSEYYARPHVQEAMRSRMTAMHGPDWRGGHFAPLDLRTFHGAGLASVFVDGPDWIVPPFDPFSPAAMAVGLTHTLPVELVSRLIEIGFDARSARLDGRTLVATAVRAGRHEVAQVLRAHGAPDHDVRPIDELIGACVRLDTDVAQALAGAAADVPLTLSRADIDVIAAAARAGAVDHLRLMFDLGLPAGRPGTAGITPLHQAAWHGRVETVRLLLECGAPVDARDMTYDGTPREWAAHGAVHCRTAEDEYRDVLQLLGAR